MDTVSLKPLVHRGAEVIAIDAPNRSDINLAIRKLPRVKWSQTHGLWYLPLSEEALQQICSTLGAVAALNIGELTEYVNKRKRVVAATTTAISAASQSESPFPLVPQRK